MFEIVMPMVIMNQLEIIEPRCYIDDNYTQHSSETKQEVKNGLNYPTENPGSSKG